MYVFSIQNVDAFTSQLYLNLVFHSPHGHANEELRKDSANPSKPLQTLAFMPESCEDDFVSSIMEGTTQSLTTSRNATKRSNSEGGEKLALPVQLGLVCSFVFCFLSQGFKVIQLRNPGIRKLTGQVTFAHRGSPGLSTMPLSPTFELLG